MFDKTYKILAIDDAKDGLMLLVFDIEYVGCKVITASSGESALSLLEKTQVDLILLDMHMPGLSGLATLKALKNDTNLQDIPVIMLSASDHEDEVVAALEFGADDYVVKPYIRKVLLARMHTALRLREKTKELDRLAKTDFLTEINNRSSFYSLTANAISQALRNEQIIVVAMFDIDFFKQVNDDYGHDVGDQVLIAFALCMSHCFRGYDIIGRLGGESFAVCLPDTDPEQAMLVCERFRQHIAQLTISNSLGSNDSKEFVAVQITTSGGIAASSYANLDIDRLLKQADVALYHAKSTGRNKIINAYSIANKNDSQTTRHFNQINTPTIKLPLEKLADIDDSQDDNFNIEGIETTIGLNNVLDDKPLYYEVLKMFFHEHNDDVNKLNKAIDEGDYHTAKHISHTLKGVSASVGAMTLFELSKQLDNEIKANNTELEAFVIPVTTQLQKVMESIQASLLH